VPSRPRFTRHRAAATSACDVDQFHKWDPGGSVTGVTDESVICVGGAMRGETVVTFSDVDYIVFPCLTARAELGWSPKPDRTGTNSAACSLATVRAAEALRLNEGEAPRLGSR
jgi:hypothetical protein